MILSRLSQIKQNYKSKSTGTLSFIMCGLNLLGTLARVLTTMVEVGDKVILASCLVAVLINGTLVAQIMWYWKGKPTTKTD